MAVKKTSKNKIGAGKAGPGRPKGVQNKSTRLLKDAILLAAEKAGDKHGKEGMVSYLVHQAAENPNAFMGLMGKVLPTQTGSGENGEIIHQIVLRGISAE